MSQHGPLTRLKSHCDELDKWAEHFKHEDLMLAGIAAGGAFNDCDCGCKFEMNFQELTKKARECVDEIDSIISAFLKKCRTKYQDKKEGRA